ncbi:MAG: EXLDI protein, partial [Ktedonobacterales bacterium]
LRRFIETEEARTQGFSEVTLKVGRQMTYTRKQFLGRELARHRSRDAETSRNITQTVFQTAKGRLVLYTRAQADWSAWTSYWSFDWDNDWNFGWRRDMPASQGGAHDAQRARDEARDEARDQLRDEARARHEERRQRRRAAHEAGRGRPSWSNWGEGGDYDMEVYETLDDLKPHIAEEFYAAVARAMRGDDVEFLDI